MKKDKDDWIYQYPSTSVNRKIIGDGDPRPYWAEANKLLYQVKNQMTFNNLGQLRSIRYFNTGAYVIAKSSFGQDFIEIHVPSGGEIIFQPSCSITLFNLPEVIQPMKWYDQGEYDKYGIYGDEVEGVDYIKTYYRYGSTNCNDCPREPDFTICDSEELAKTYGWFAEQTCTPFVFKDKYIPKGMTVPFKDGYPNNRCIHGTCQAEIIKFSADVNGTYFLWKAYTEWSSLGPWYANFTQSGLGHLLVRGFVNAGGI